MSTRTFRFGVVAASAESVGAWREKARRVEALGYSTLLLPDHFGNHLPPIAALMAAADATSTLRIGSQVFDNDYRHPVVLAKEAAALDLLSDGRFELGLGAGWHRPEYAQAGIPFDAPGVRVDRFEEGLRIIKGLLGPSPVTFSGKHYTVTDLEGWPKPVQKPYPPIMIGGGARRILGIAAREADIVSVVPRSRADGSGMDTADALPADVERKIGWLREAAPHRFETLELQTLLFAAAVTDRPRDAAEVIAQRFDTPIEAVLATPHLLIGSAAEAEEALLARRARFGISYYAVFEEHLEAMAPIVARLRGR